MIKAFLFDYGGVITEGGAGDEIAARLATNLGIPFEKGFELMGFVWSDLVRGKLTTAEFWERIEQKHGASVPEVKRNIWNTYDADMHPIPEMTALVERLKSEGYRVGLLSNVIPVTAGDIRSHQGYNMFDFTILSCDTGFAKPDKEIYELALAKLPDVLPSEVVFVDDQERCLEPAIEMGIQTILAKDPAQITDEIDKLLIQ